MEQVIEQLVREVRSRYYGKYRGFVADTEDPERLGRLKLRVPAILGEQVTNWALPCAPYGGLAGRGWYVLPDVGAQVWVEFEGGELRQPIWTGTFWQASGDVPLENGQGPETRVLQSAKDHRIELEDTDGSERVLLKHGGGSQLEIDPQGTVAVTTDGGASVRLDEEAGEIVVEDANGNVMTMSSAGTTVVDANGNKVEMAAAGITVKGQQIVVEGTQVLLGGQGGEPVIKGQSFLTLFATHIHTCSAPGSPTSPPIPQGEAATLSTGVMTK